jgi:hypothetical protein
MDFYVFNGKITTADCGDDAGLAIEPIVEQRLFSGEVLRAVSGTTILAKWANDNIYGNKVTVRYAVSDQPITDPSEFIEQYIQVAMGKPSSAFYGSYSELTGHLWTNEKFTVGGHDIILELSASRGKYAHIEIEVH